MKRLFLLLTFFFWTVPAWATNYYVDIMNGNNANPGTFAQPVKDPPYGLNLAMCGDTVYIRGGNSPSTRWTYGASAFVDKGCSSFGAGITMRNYPGEYITLSNSDFPSTVVAFVGEIGDPPIHHSLYARVISDTIDIHVEGSGNIVMDCTFTHGCTVASGIGGDYVWLENVELKNSGAGDNYENNYCINPVNGDHWTLINIHCHHSYGHGIYGDANYFTVQGGRFDHWGLENNFKYAIQFYEANGTFYSSHNRIDGTEFDAHTNGFGIVFQGKDNIASNLWFHDTPTTSVVFYSTCGIYGPSDPSPDRSCALYNSTIVGTEVVGGSNNISIINNIITYRAQNDGASGLIIENNLMGDTIIDMGTGTISSGNIIGPPDFTTEPQVSGMSQAIGNGQNLSSIFTTDFYNHTRPSPTTAWTIGAYEANITTCTPTKLGFINQPSNATIGATLNAVSVGLYSAGDVLCTGSSANITIAKTGGTTWNSLQTSSGSLTKATSAGVASWSTLFVSPTTGSGTITATSGGLTSAVSNSITILAAAIPCGGVWAGCTLYIDRDGGDDTLSGLDKTHAWKHAPNTIGVTAGVGPGYIGDPVGGGGICNGTPCNLAGISFIFKGGVTIPRVDFETGFSCGMCIGTSGSGTTRGVDLVYYGVDQTWFTGSSWTRPVFDSGGSGSGAQCHATTGIVAGTTYVYIDNIEFTGLYWNASCDAIGTPGYLQTGYGGHNVLDHLYGHGWSHDTAAHGTHDNCFLVAGNPEGIDTTSILRNSLFYNEAEPAFGAQSCYGSKDGPPIQYNNYYGYVINGALLAYPVAFYQNTCDHVGGSFDPAQHDQCFESNGDNGLVVYNNFMHDIQAGYAINTAPVQGSTVSVFNNVMYNLTSTTVPVAVDSVDHCATPCGTLHQFANTIESTSNQLMMACPVNGDGCLYQNNHFIGPHADANTCLGSGGSANCHQDHNTLQLSKAIANADGYSVSTTPPYYPTVITGATVGTGTDLSATCTPPYLTALCTTSTVGVRFDATTHTIIAPNVTDAVTRSQSSPNTGAYQFAVNTPLIVSATPSSGSQGLTYDVNIMGLQTSWTVDSVVTTSCAGIVVLYDTFYNATRILATFAIDINATPGQCDVVVTTGMHTDTLTNGFTINGVVTATGQKGIRFRTRGIR